MSEQISEFERRILEAFSEKKGMAANIGGQLDGLRVESREETGVGVFVNFYGAHAESRGITTAITGVDAEDPDGSDSIGFVLFLKNGFVHMLEGFSYFGNWPNDLSGYQIVVE
ncbi:MAG: hypothetical protein AAGJ32_03480 [Pseudomonadota bacterium]